MEVEVITKETNEMDGAGSEEPAGTVPEVSDADLEDLDVAPVTLDEAAQRFAQWEADHKDKLVEALRTFTEEKTRGQPKRAKVVLQKAKGNYDKMAEALLSSVVESFARDRSITSAAKAAAKELSALVGHELRGTQDSITAGIQLLDIASHATKAFRIVQTYADRPNIGKDGKTIQVPLGYVLKVERKSFLDWIARNCRVGSPEFVTERPKDWTGQKDGGAKEQRGGLVHGADEWMKATPDTSPRLFQTISAMQSCAFTINPTAKTVLEKYDAKKAVAHFVAKLTAEEATLPIGRRAVDTLNPKVYRGIVRRLQREAEQRLRDAGVDEAEVSEKALQEVDAVPDADIEALVDAAMPDAVRYNILKRAKELARL